MTLSSGKRTSIAGASTGIGEAIALLFARAGIHVALVSRSQDKLEKVARSAQEHGVKAKSYPCDLPRVDRVGERRKTIATQLRPPIDLLVNRAGMGYTSFLTKTSLADWKQVLHLNLTTVFECVRAILPSMGERRHGTSANVASIATTQVFPHGGVYRVSKFGLMAFFQTLAVKDPENGIRVGSICPGAVDASIWNTQTVRADFDRSTMLTPQTVAQMILQTVQLPPQAVIEERTLMSNAGVL